MSALKIGVLAPEFPPQVGGMPAYAVGLARGLAATDEVVVYTMEGRGDDALPLEQRDVLTRDLCGCVERLGGERVDVWLALNAGLLALAPTLSAPMLGAVHGNDFLSPWLIYQRPWVERLERRHFWWRVHGRVRRWLIERDLRAGVRRAAHLFANSRATAALLARRFPDASGKLTVVAPGADDTFFAAPPRRKAPTATLRLLTVTRLERWTRRKNVDGLLRAMTLLPAGLDVSCDVVGDGDDRARLEQIAHDLRLGGHVTFHGRLDAGRLRQLYADADLFVLASRASPHDVEGFGIVYVEAAALGVPSICSRDGGATDAVEDGRSGIVIAESTPEAIAAGIVRFHAERERFAPEQVRAFAEQFTWSRAAGAVRARLEAAVRH